MDQILIPKSTFRNVNGSFGGSINILAYGKPSLFRSTERPSQTVDSIVISVSLGEGVTVSGNPAIVFNLAKRDSTVENVLCSYWKGEITWQNKTECNPFFPQLPRDPDIAFGDGK